MDNDEVFTSKFMVARPIKHLRISRKSASLNSLPVTKKEEHTTPLRRRSVERPPSSPFVKRAAVGRSLTLQREDKKENSNNEVTEKEPTEQPVPRRPRQMSLFWKRLGAIILPAIAGIVIALFCAGFQRSLCYIQQQRQVDNVALTALMQQKLIGQTEAIKTIADVVTNYTSARKHVIMEFRGARGVGKSMAASILSHYFRKNGLPTQQYILSLYQHRDQTVGPLISEKVKCGANLIVFDDIEDAAEGTVANLLRNSTVLDPSEDKSVIVILVNSEDVNSSTASSKTFSEIFNVDVKVIKFSPLELGHVKSCFEAYLISRNISVSEEKITEFLNKIPSYKENGTMYSVFGCKFITREAVMFLNGL